MKRTALEWKQLYNDADFHRNYFYDGRLGFFYDSAENVFRESVFRIWSPFAEEARIRFYRDGSEGDALAVHEMKRLE